MPNVGPKKLKSASAAPPAASALAPRFHWPEQSWPVCIVLAIAVLIVFWPVQRFDFVNYDDPDYVSANSHVQSGLTWAGIRWAFTTGHASNWHPLTWLSHMTDWQLFGNSPGPQHMTSVAIHAINTVLLFLLLRRMTGAHVRSAIVAALFGLHPLRAESVVWISERKDVLSALFLFLTLDAYCRFASSRLSSWTELRKKPWRYCLALLCFALGLMSKPMLVTVPFLLMIVDYWPLARFSLDDAWVKVRWLVLEKLPFLALAACSSVITFLVQQKGGAVSTSLPLSGRLANALVSYVRYLAKTIWPVDLSVLYPHPGHWPVWQVLGSGLILLVITFVAIAQMRRRPYFIVGWFWFLGSLVPVIGLIQVGIQSMADRYTYIPGIGLFLIAVWGSAEVLVRWPSAKPAIALGATAALGICACLCAHQIRFWHDSQTLFQRAVDVTSNNYLAYNNLGFYLSGKGNLEQAKENYLKSININPLYQDALNNMGFALAGERKYSEAVPYYEAALRVSPNHPEVHNNLGNALSELGRLDEAIAHYQIVLKQQPDHADAQNNLGIALAMQGKLDEALKHFRAAIRARPNYASAHSNLGNALAASHRVSEAIAEYENSLRLNPNDAQAHNNLGNALIEQGKLAEAIQHYTVALRLNPNNPEAEFNVAIAYERVNNPQEAAQHFQQALRLNPGNLEAKRQLEMLKAGK